MNPEQEQMPIADESAHVEQKAPDAIERFVVREEHSDIPEKIAGERIVVFPHDHVANANNYFLPSLGDKRVRYDENGQVLIYRSTGKKIKASTPENLTVGDVGFDSISVVESNWSTCPDVETAIRQTRHIADKYDRDNGLETLSLLGFHRTMRQVAKKMQLPAGERPPLSEVNEFVLKELSRYGYDNVRSSDKKEIVEIILDAVQKDSLSRENPSRTRLMLAHLYPRITKMILGNEQKRNKYRYLESLLLKEREADRMPVVRLSEDIKKMEKMDERNREAENIARNARRKAHSDISPTSIRLAPYVQLGAEVRYLLFGHNTQEDINILSRYLGSDRANELAGLPTYYELSPSERRERLSSIAMRIDEFMEKADQELDKNSGDDFWDKVSEL